MVAFRTPLGNTVPTAPGNLTATAAGANQINLSWTASTSANGIANYVVQRCLGAGCTNFAQIAASAGTTYTDMGLSPSTSYNYQVQAVDTVGNASAFRALQRPPRKLRHRRPRPGNLTATAAGASQINLSWTASASGYGIAYYVVERCQGAGCTKLCADRCIGWDHLFRYGPCCRVRVIATGCRRRYGREYERAFEHCNGRHASSATPDGAR